MTGRRAAASAGPALLLAVLILAAPAAFAGDFNLAVGNIRADSTFVRLDLRLTDPLPADEGGEPAGSTPAALAYTIEVWRSRSAWFDALVSSRTFGYRLEYDHLRSLWRVVTPADGQLEVADRDELVRLLCVQDSVAGARLSDLKPGKDYYFAVTARLTPIDINRLGEVEGWLSGEIRTGARRGGVLGVPKAVVGILADVAGFGDRSTIARSARFRLREPTPGIVISP
jgi:hypothetical protein